AETTSEVLPMRQKSSSTDKAPFSFDNILQGLEKLLGSAPKPPTPPNVEQVTALLESWGKDGNLAAAYNALSPKSALLEGLDIEAWTKRRAQWLETAKTGLVKITYAGEKEKLAPDRVIVEALWSLPIGNPTAEHPPKDLPTPTCILNVTGSRWFWTSY